MKTMNCVWVLLILLASPVLTEAVTVINYDFEGDGLGAGEWQDGLTPTGWTWNGLESRGIGVDGGNHFYWHGTTSVLSQTTGYVITAANASFTLQVDAYNSWQGSPRIALYYDDAGTPVELGSSFLPAGGDTWAAWQTVELTTTTTAASVGKNLGIALSLEGGTGWAQFDNVRLESNTIRLLSPASEAQQVSIHEDLVWYTAPTVEYVDLYFGDDPNLTETPEFKKLDLEPATTTTYDPGVLAFETTYHWRVDAYEPNLAPGGSGYVMTTSGTRSFTTRGPNPVIEAITPYSQAIIGDGSANAQMTAGGDNLEFFEWYKQGDPNPLTEGAKYSGVDSAILTIHNVVLADEGVYECVASNSLSPNTDTASAVLVTQRQISWWKLDGDLSDSIQDLYPAAPAFDGDSEPNYITGKIDEALDLHYSESYPPIFIPGTEEFFNFYQSGLTVSAWVNTSYVSGADWPVVFSKLDAATETGYAIATNGDPGAPLFDIDDSRIIAPAADSIADGGWHLLAVTFDGAVKRIYVDGVLKAQSAAATTNAAGNAAPIAIGAWGSTSEFTYFEGVIDDIRVYSYALADSAVADLYIDVEGGWVCTGGNPDYDLDGNCKVDIADFALLAGNWLDCNRYPISECN